RVALPIAAWAARPADSARPASVFSRLAVAAAHAEEATHALTARAEAAAEATRAAEVPLVAAAETGPSGADRADAHLNRDGRYASIRGGVLYATRDFASSDGAYDLYIHFHGNTRVVLESAEHVHLNALVAIVNLGVGSAPYEDAYAMPGSYKALLEGIARGAAERGLAAPHVRRIAIGTWSAGYGAVSGILRQKDARDGLDALLCMDGIHVGYNEEGPHEPKRLNLAPFIEAAKSAARGEILFSITHSAVVPEGYASTTETADVLLDEVGAHRVQADASEAPEHVEIAAAKGAVAKRLEKSLEPTTEARVGGLHVRGYRGGMPEDHMAHLLQMAATVMPELAARWEHAP
ncbi:MAG TPA: hypothetical protein VGM56_27910, partial [Byssovorax sp.]